MLQKSTQHVTQNGNVEQRKWSLWVTKNREKEWVKEQEEEAFSLSSWVKISFNFPFDWILNKSAPAERISLSLRLFECLLHAFLPSFLSIQYPFFNSLRQQVIWTISAYPCPSANWVSLINPLSLSEFNLLLQLLSKMYLLWINSLSPLFLLFTLSLFLCHFTYLHLFYHRTLQTIVLYDSTPQKSMAPPAIVGSTAEVNANHKFPVSLRPSLHHYFIAD